MSEMVTFEVDEVTPVLERLPSRDLAEVATGALLLGRDPQLQVIDHGPTHALLGAVHLAFAEHRPLVLSPDVVWLTIAQGIAQHVRLHAERLRPRLVRHAGKGSLEVEVNDLPSTPDEWRAVVEALSHKLAGEIGDGRARLFACSFSTSTAVERLAGQVTMLDAYSPYFECWVRCVCGIPSITLTGTAGDWRAIRERVEVIAHDLDLEVWCRSLRPILDAFVDAVEGRVDRAFWKRIYKPADAYGGEAITGWIARLYPYVLGMAAIDHPNPLLALTIDEPRDVTEPLAVIGVKSSDVLAGPSTVRIDICGQVATQAVHVDAGVTIVTQDELGRIVPMVDWRLRPGRAVIQDVVERIRAECPDFEAGTSNDYDAGPAELNAFRNLVQRASLCGGRWRVRAAHEGPGLPLPGYHVRPVLDGPGGAIIACAVRFDGDVYVTWVLVERGKAGVIGTTLVDVLTTMLDTGTPPPVTEWL